jgi:hypothetical protein
MMSIARQCCCVVRCCTSPAGHQHARGRSQKVHTGVVAVQEMGVYHGIESEQGSKAFTVALRVSRVPRQSLWQSLGNYCGIESEQGSEAIIVAIIGHSLWH